MKYKKIVSLFLVLLFITGVCGILRYYFILHSINSLNESLKTLATSVNQDDDDDKEENPEENPEENDQSSMDFISLRKLNKDIIGWISIPGTVVDYPIFKVKDEDEDFYLTHDANKAKSKAGSIYVRKESSSDFSDKITFVYGHNMKNNTMFGSLDRYKSKEFMQKNDKLFIYIPGDRFEYRIMGYEIIKARKLKEASEGFEGVVLCTCTNENDERFLLFAKRLE